MKRNQDYDKYSYSAREILKYGVQGVLLCVAVDYLFYKSFWVLLPMLPFPILFLKWKKKQLIQERKRKLDYQFKDALNSMNVAVQAGYSVENAVTVCVHDLEQLYEKEDDILAEFRYIEAQQHVSVPVEELFMDLANRCKVEDIENFASVFYIAKRNGGDMGNVILKVSRMLGDKIDVKNVTGAGDSFVAGIGYGYMNNLSIKDTLKYAMAMSIITITHEETINPDMCHNSVENFVKNNKWVEKN